MLHPPGQPHSQQPLSMTRSECTSTEVVASDGGVGSIAELVCQAECRPRIGTRH